MFNRSKTLEKQLAEANDRLRAASAGFAAKHQGGEWEEFHGAIAEVLRLERELAKSLRQPYAVPCDFPVKWDVGAPLPFLLCSDYRCFLTFYVNDPDPNWDGTYVTVVDPSSPNDASLCLVEFSGCASAKLGHPNEEVQSGHYLAGRGLDGYTAQIVMNSPWLTEVSKTNSVHPYDDPERWKHIKHYVFWFHDSTFECLAQTYKVEVSTESMADLLARVQDRLLE